MWLAAARSMMARARFDTLCALTRRLARAGSRTTAEPLPVPMRPECGRQTVEPNVSRAIVCHLYFPTGVTRTRWRTRLIWPAPPACSPGSPPTGGAATPAPATSRACATNGRSRSGPAGSPPVRSSQAASGVYSGPRPGCHTNRPRHVPSPWTERASGIRCSPHRPRARARSPRPSSTDAARPARPAPCCAGSSTPDSWSGCRRSPRTP